MLEVESLCVSYGEAKILDDVTLSVNAGEIVALLGANGAGKTTTLKTISGLTRSSSGQIRLEGKPITGLPPDQVVARGIAQVPEGRRIFPQLTVEENLKAGAHLLSERRQLLANLEQMYALFPRLKERRTQLGQTLSGGEQQMLALGRAMMSEPKMLLLDEPSLGLAPLIVLEVARWIRSFSQRGITVLLVEQNAKLALSLASRAYVLERGRVVLSGRAVELRNNPKVVASYLGGGTAPARASNQKIN